MFRHKPALQKTGAGAPVFPSRCNNLSLFHASLFTAIGIAGWLCGFGIGEFLARTHLRRLTAQLPAIEMLSGQIASTLREQGVCLDAPAPSFPTLQRDTLSQIASLKGRFAIQGPCIDLAIAQNEFEMLQMESAILRRIRQKQSLTTGLLSDSLAYRSRDFMRRHR
jgi:hypothetical protein